MKPELIRLNCASLLLSAALASNSYAIPITVNMTGDNDIVSGGLCDSTDCTSFTSWADLGADTSQFDDWTQSSSVALDLDDGTYHFAWQIQNSLPADAGNPAGLLAEILWDDKANYSSSSWEIFLEDGSFVEYAQEYGLNGDNNIWANVNQGGVGGISTASNWIYTSNNFADAEESAWIRTSITVPEPSALAILAAGLVCVGFSRRKPVTARKS